MSPLPGVQGMNADPAVQYQDAGVLEAHGFSLDQRHMTTGGALGGQTWPAAYGHGYTGSPYPPIVDNQSQTGEAYADLGYPGDATPRSHSAPYARGIHQPNYEDKNSYADVSYELAMQQVQLHSPSFGADRLFNQNSPVGKETPAHYTTDRYDAPNSNVLATAVPGQLRQGTGGNGGNGKSDTTQGYGQLNSTPEFQMGHSIRRVQHDTLHWDRSLDNNPAVPFRGKFPVEQANFNTDSSYGPVAGVATQGAQIPWEGRIGNPSAYQTPSEVTVNPSPPSGGDVWAYG